MPRHIVDNDTLIARLAELGYLGPEKQTSRGLNSAIKRFQKFHKLPETGIVEEDTAHVLFRPRCGLPDFEARQAPCFWPMTEITYWSDLTLNGIDSATAASAYDTAIKQWEAVVGLTFTRVSESNKANIAARGGRGRRDDLDGRGGTLAWSNLPCNASARTQLLQVYDQAEMWSYEMAVGVMTHELGHALGLPHSEAGNLMQPYYDPRILKPQPGDIAAIKELYPTAAPARPAPPSAGRPESIVIDGKTYKLVPM